MTTPAPAVLNFKTVERNTLKGFFDLSLPPGMVLFGLQLHQKNDAAWIGMPAKPFTKQDGSASWVKIVDFCDRAARDRFQGLVLPLALQPFERAKEAA